MCFIFPTRRHEPSEHQTIDNVSALAIAGSPTSQRKPSRLIKLNPLASTKPVQNKSAAIPIPPKYRSRGSNTPRVQDVTDPAIRTSLFGRFAQIDHHQHYGSGVDGRQNITYQDSGCAGVRGSALCGNEDPKDSVHPSSTCSTKDDSGSGGHDVSSRGGHEAFGYTGVDVTGLGGGHSLGYSDGCGIDGGDGAGGGCH